MAEKKRQTDKQTQKKWKREGGEKRTEYERKSIEAQIYICMEEDREKMLKRKKMIVAACTSTIDFVDVCVYKWIIRIDSRMNIT